MLARLKGKRGFTLVELMIVVAIIGVLAALAIYGVRKYIANSKTAEARMTLGRIAKDASAAYNRENMDSAVLSEGSSATISNDLCKSASPVPSTLDRVKGKKYQSSAADWSAGNAKTGWQCLKFSLQDPQYFQYSYTATTGTAGKFTATANGDLNADDVASTFTLQGEVTTGGVKIAPNIGEVSPEE